MYINLSVPDLVILVSALNSYQYDLSEREKRSDYWFRSHVVESYKQRSEDNKVLLLARMRHVDALKDTLLPYIPPTTMRD